MNYDFIRQFSKTETASSFLLLISAILAMLIANSPLSPIYNMLVDLPVSIEIGDFTIAKPLLLWINDGLMALFFLLVGLELKREFLEGELSSVAQVILPLIGAVGGMAVPALIYVYFNYDDPVALNGWAIPAATDIAFALGILALLGSRVPLSLKVFLTSLAIFDDIGAILIIAVFYTSKISFLSLAVAAICVLVLLLLNMRGVTERSPYFLVGMVMWVAMLKSGVHATLAGIILAAFIPLYCKKNKLKPNESPLKILEEDLHSIVAFAILPIFAFANSGIDLSNFNTDVLLHPVTLGIACGLFFGNQIGVFTLCFLAVKLGFTQLPKDVNWLSLYGVSALCGVGFTMSLFIGSLAFEETGVNLLFDERVGIFLGSLASGLVGYIVLTFSLNDSAKEATPETA